MNIFEQYGGYEVVKQAISNYKKSGDIVTAAGSELQCLEYRRKHNIFEDNDCIVSIHDYEPSHLYKVKNVAESGYEYGNDGVGMQCYLTKVLGITLDMQQMEKSKQGDDYEKCISYI